jgi:glycine dehydrogenase
MTQSLPRFTQPLAANAPSVHFPTDAEFIPRHIGPQPAEVAKMLAVLGMGSLSELVDRTIPAAIQLKQPLAIETVQSEYTVLNKLKEIAAKNQIFRSYIGMGYANCITPTVIQRNILENPGWYTQYTPYQPEISQGRLEALLNYQTVIMDLTGMAIANASLLDEGTAAVMVFRRQSLIRSGYRKLVIPRRSM